jgi:hypothetical protein
MESEKQEETKVENKETNVENSNNNPTEEKIDYKNISLEDDDLNKEDIDEIVDYLKDLDYEKYAHDMEIREALELLKSKMKKDEEEKRKTEQKVIINEDKNININKNERKENEEGEKIENKTIEKVEENKPKVIKENKPIIDTEKEKKQEEIKKYKVAEQIAKTDRMKGVHSIQSVRKLIQAQGLEGNIDPLRITVIKENPLTRDDEYIPNKLPFLHSLPLV